MIETTASPQMRVRFLMQGLVQGQGVRPTIARLAANHRVFGTVCNSSRGVEIKAIGEPSKIDIFEAALKTRFPNAAFVVESVESLDRYESSSFRMIDSEIGDGLHTVVPLDLAICEDCITEVRSAPDWRGGYPFTTCAVCGPRYSLVRQMPFDRASTTMNAFPMCPRCEAEYRDPDDRRFHAQTVCCSSCGPRCWVTDSEGNELAGKADVMKYVSDRIARGDIVAVKGIGGYQLICDASNDLVVQTLRRRKHRPSKPLSIMVRDMTTARQLASVSDAEQQALQSQAGPIVLLRAIDSKLLSDWISPNLDSIGVMLPMSALHVILADRVDRPLVVTSGNVHGSPIIYQNEVAQRELATIADIFLHHDREIVHPIDDSVVQCIDGKPMTIRAARGIAPMTFSFSSNTTRVATGGHQKVAAAIQTTSAIVLAPHIGDMETERCRMRFVDEIPQAQSLCQVDPSIIAHDRHPNYFTTDWAIQNAGSTKPIQHHHAHVAAAMLEHDLLDETVLGIAFDGTGDGGDGTIWGGEALLATSSQFQRIGCLRPFHLPGGEASIKQPWRIAASLRSQIGDTADVNLRYMIDHGPITSSMGRLFDGIAALVLGIESVDDEGEAAMRLEAACDQDERSSYEFAFPSGGLSKASGGSHAAITGPAQRGRATFESLETRNFRHSPTGRVGRLSDRRGCPHLPRAFRPTLLEKEGEAKLHDLSEGGMVPETSWQFDWRPILQAIDDELGNVSPGRIAMKFHRAVADLACRIANRYGEFPCVLCGGVFQNRVLLELIGEAAECRSLDIRMPGRIPVNDGGLAIGQIVIANQGE